MSPFSVGRRSRPALWTAIAFAAGIGIADSAAPPVAVPAALAGLAGVGLIWSRLATPVAGSGSRWLTPLLVMALGALRYQCDTSLLPADHISTSDLPPPMYPHPELGCGCDERSWRRFWRRWFIAERTVWSDLIIFPAPDLRHHPPAVCRACSL